MQEWQKNVFDGYLPCSILYEDADALKKLKEDDKNGMYCSMAFTHESLTNEKLKNPAEYVQNILSVLHDGAAPPITELHSQRILQVSPFSGIELSESQKKQLKTFDPARANSCIQVDLSLLHSDFYDCLFSVLTSNILFWSRENFKVCCKWLGYLPAWDVFARW